MWANARWGWRRVEQREQQGEQGFRAASGGWSAIEIACISASRRPRIHACMRHIDLRLGLGRRSGFVAPVSLSCRQVTYPTRKGGHLLVGCHPKHAPVSSGCRSWAIRASEQRLLASVSCRGRRRQGHRVQGSWVRRGRLLCRHRS